MPRRITQRDNFSQTRVNHIENVLRNAHEAATVTWNNHNQQILFNTAIELYRRRPISAERRALAEGTLRRLVRNYNRTWNRFGLPSVARFGGRNPNNSNSNSNPSAGLVYGSNSNSNNNSPPPRHDFGRSPTFNNRARTVTRAAAAPNYSKVRKFAERWRLKGPVKLVNLPINKNTRTDPVMFHTFRSGQEAIQHQRRNTEGRIISTRYYLLPTIERLAGVNWKTIRRMHPNKVLFKEAGKGNKFLATKHLPNVITRLPMYRKHLTLVKFK